MSRGTGVVNKPNLFNEANEDLYNPYAEETVESFFSEIDYPEWNDAELNAEVWDEGKTKLISSSPVLFEDPNPVVVPPTIRNLVATWRRPSQVFPYTNLSVYDPLNEDYTLQVSSQVAHCSIFKTFLENLKTLQFIALKYGFPVEMETSLFVSNTQGEPWRPWHHIYAMCKAGKGTVHKPLYSPFGKYVLRLFFMGSWRRFVVDDKIPCNTAGKCLLPMTQVPGELWPIILMKGLLKIVSFLPFEDDLPFISVFTAWTGCRIMALNKTYEELWRRLVLLSRKCEVTEKEEMDAVTQGFSKKESSKKNSVKDSEEVKDEGCCCVMANLELPEEQSKKIIVVRMNRDSPLMKATRRESTKPWKKIRWVYWALKRGFWTDESQLPPYRLIYCINFTEKLSRLLMPDPKLESFYFDLPPEEKENILSFNEKTFDTEEWFDFNKVYDYLFSLNVYFKPSSFFSSFKVSCLISAKSQNLGKRAESVAEGKTASKPPSSSNTFFFSPILLRNNNEPPLMFCESTAGIFLSITLWVFPKSFKWNASNPNDPEFLKFSSGSLLVEHFDWRNPEQGEIIGAIKTAGTSSLWICLKPGRHVFKFWLYTDSPYLISVHSNVNIVIHKGPKIRFLMKNEAERILHYINNVSNAFIALTQKFGKPDLPASLKEFYSIIIPGNDAAPDYFKKLDEFIETFLNCILLSLKNTSTPASEIKIMMGALQSLFLNPKIYCELPRSTYSVYGASNKKPAKKIELAVQERTLSEILNFPWSSDDIKKVTRIQKIFRGYRVRLLWKCQTPVRKEFKPYTERLKKICDLLFSPPKREVEVGKLIRRILMISPDLLITFKFYSDFRDTIDVQEYTGKMANVEPFAWVPIARFIIICDSDLPIPCAFYLSCNLEQFVIQGVDNDTNEEIFRLVNCISPRYYYRNFKGYTIFVHGWNEAKPKTVNWRLQMVRVKYFDMLHLCNTMMSQCNQTNLPVIEIFDIKNFYVPNHKARICRCLIKIYKRTLLTLRFSVSYPKVKFVLQISLDKKFTSIESEAGTSEGIIAKVNSTEGAALMSAVFLEHFENSYWGESDVDYTLYVLEAYVLNNSWPLTKHEWGVIEPFRVNGEAWRDSSGSLQFKKSATDSKRKFSRISRRETKPVENPFWFLQVIIESQGAEQPVQQMIIEEDKSFAEYVRNMKYQWEEKDPGRRSKGNDLRMNFLYMIWLEKKNFMGEGECDYEMGKGEDEDNISDFNLLIHRMSSFSYLLEDTQPRRFIKSPRILPGMPTNDLLYRYTKESLEMTDISLNSGTKNQASDTSAESNENTIEETEEYSSNFLSQCIYYREVMKNYIKNEQKLSNQLMEEAYETRVKAIRQISRMVE